MRGRPVSSLDGSRDCLDGSQCEVKRPDIRDAVCRIESTGWTETAHRVLQLCNSVFECVVVNDYNAGRPGWRRKRQHMLRFDLRQLTKKGRVAAGQSYGCYCFRDEERIASIGVRTIPHAFLLDYT